MLFRVPTQEERARLGRTYRSYGVPLCKAPCDTTIAASPERLFVVGGADVTRSEPFALHDRSGDVVLSVQPGSLPARRNGAMLTAFGGAFTGAGLIVTALGATVLSGGDEMHWGPAWNMYTMAGLVTAGFAVGVLAGGITLLARNQTEVTFGLPSARVRFEGGALRF